MRGLGSAHNRGFSRSPRDYVDFVFTLLDEQNRGRILLLNHQLIHHRFRSNGVRISSSFNLKSIILNLTRPFRVFSSLRVHFNRVSLFDEEGNVYYQAGFQSCRFAAARGGVAFDARRSAYYFERDFDGKLDTERFFVEKKQIRRFALFEIADFIFGECFGDGDCFKILLVHEMRALLIMVKVLRLVFDDFRALDALPGFKRILHDFTGGEIAHLGLHHRPALLHPDELRGHNFVRFAVPDDDNAFFEFGKINEHYFMNYLPAEINNNLMIFLMFVF